MPPAISFRDVSVLAAGRPIIENVSFEVQNGESVALIGRSGAGKTTALKLINGLVTPSRGEVLVEGVSLRAHDLIGLRRRIGYVMQSPALFPHRNVMRNVATVPRLLGWPPERILAESERILGELSLPPGDYGGRFPRTLSGGEQQRVGIARALVFAPSILLCDEPFSALDPLVRREQQDALLGLRGARALTMLFVTHDLHEAMRLCDRLLLFEKGRLVNDLSPAEFVASDQDLPRAFVAAAVLPGRGDDVLSR
jgi:osmoprotectant transport system ATP-binding protein